MSSPIPVYSARVDPEGVLRLLKERHPDLVVKARGDGWSATISGPKRFLRKPATLTVHNAPENYAEPNWSQQRAGMTGYFARFPGFEQRPIARLIQSFGFVLGCVGSPGLDIESNPDDFRIQTLLAVAKHLDGVLFLPGILLDSSGRSLIRADGNADPAAVLPNLPTQHLFSVQVGEVPAAGSDSRGEVEDEEPHRDPPSAERVVRRAFVLAAVGARGLLEQEPRQDRAVEETRQGIVKWAKALDLYDEFEFEEWEFLNAPLGAPKQQAIFNGTWRLEGLAMLSWALKLFALPGHDEQVDPGKLLPALTFLRLEESGALLKNPTLRPAAELEAARQKQFALHWRVRDFGLQPKAIDFEDFARTAWFGPLNIEGVRLIEKDLALKDRPILRAPVEHVRLAASIATERHRAANWLAEGGELYSEVDVST